MRQGEASPGRDPCRLSSARRSSPVEPSPRNSEPGGFRAAFFWGKQPRRWSCIHRLVARFLEQVRRSLGFAGYRTSREGISIAAAASFPLPFLGVFGSCCWTSKRMRFIPAPVDACRVSRYRQRRVEVIP